MSSTCLSLNTMLQERLAVCLNFDHRTNLDCVLELRVCRKQPIYIRARRGKGVLTETTAKLAASLSLAAARRIVKADEFMRAGKYDDGFPFETILVNCSRGPVIDEVALIEHLRENSMFRVGHDDFEDEPYRKPGLADMKNVVVVPHTASATKGMATLAALNEKIKEYPIWSNPNSVEAFLDENSPPPAACSSIVNSKALGLLVSKL
ncbi:Glycerate dehydrogenase HPR, peroxisomal [Capsicum annuum]|uniref:Glycerate dehydrogenase HPR, peroxisomal n=1 Tax=Capsicum annuum TaxID=4072 RepID=A0A2G2Z0K8_CAPAN|nr:Glycerate dehydrogenase HPR, peroxisomal [Capsicum annuum]